MLDSTVPTADRMSVTTDHTIYPLSDLGYAGVDCLSCITSLQARSIDLPASPAGLLGRFAPSGFALRARISLTLLARVSRFALTKIFEKKSVSQSTRNALKRIEMQKKI